MITPKPEVVLPVVAFEPATRFHAECLGIWEDDDFSGSDDPSDPYVVIGYDGRAWRIHEFWGPPIPPKTLFEKILTAIFGQDRSPSIVGREVTPIQLSLDDFKSEACRRILAHPNGLFSDELLAGEALPRGGDLEALTAALIERVSANVRAATSIADAMDAMLFAQRDQYEWAEEFHRRPAVSP
jgi:hypothetical protein